MQSFIESLVAPEVTFLSDFRRDGLVFASDDAYGHGCTVTGAAWTSQGRSFDGVDDYLDLGSKAAIRDFTAMSCIIWIKTVLKAGVSWQMPIDSGRYGGIGYAVNQDDGVRSLIPILRNTAGTVANLTTVTFTEDTWLQTGWVWDGATGWSITNGALLAGVAESGTIQSSGNPYLGRRNDAASQFWAGSIGLFQLWNRPLQPNEVWNHYTATKERFR